MRAMECTHSKGAVIGKSTQWQTGRSLSDSVILWFDSEVVSALLHRSHGWKNTPGEHVYPSGKGKFLVAVTKSYSSKDFLRTLGLKVLVQIPFPAAKSFHTN